MHGCTGYLLAQLDGHVIIVAGDSFYILLALYTIPTVARTACLNGLLIVISNERKLRYLSNLPPQLYLGRNKDSSPLDNSKAMR